MTDLTLLLIVLFTVSLIEATVVGPAPPNGPDLMERLKGEGTMTLFAPTDSAFAEVLSQEELNKLMDPAWQPQLVDVSRNEMKYAKDYQRVQRITYFGTHISSPSNCPFLTCTLLLCGEPVSSLPSPEA